MIPSTIADLIITGLILGYGQKIGSKVDSVEDMTKSIIDNLPALVETSQELQVKLQDRLTALKYRPRLYEKLTIDLSEARNKEKYDVTGSYIIAQSIDGTLEVRFNEQDADAVTVDKDNRTYEVNFDCLYITNSAQSGKSVTFLIGKGHAFVGSSITPVDITAQSIEKLAIDIASQTIGNLSVDLVAQTIESLLMTVNAQNIGIRLQPEWAVYQGQGKYLSALAQDKTWGESIYTNYTVPSGKTLYIVSFSGSITAQAASDGDSNQMCHGELQLIDWSSAIGGNGGFAISFPSPVVVGAGEEVYGFITNYANHAVKMMVSIVGYEV